MATLDVIGNLSLHNTSGYEGDFSSYVELVRDEKRDVVTLSEREQKVLDLSDRLQELELEGSLLKAHQVVPPGDPYFWPAPGSQLNRVVTVGESLNNDDIDEQCRLAGVDLLKAKATYNLRNQVIENVLMSDPILQAVHSGTNATSVERYGL